MLKEIPREIKERVAEYAREGSHLGSMSYRCGYWMDSNKNVSHVSEMDLYHLENIKSKLLRQAKSSLIEKYERSLKEEDLEAEASKNSFWAPLIEELNKRSD
jgi:hypothetical protein